MTQDKEKEKTNKYRYECYICGMSVVSHGEPVKHCTCKHGEPKKILNWDEIKGKLGK